MRLTWGDVRVGDSVVENDASNGWAGVVEVPDVSARGFGQVGQFAIAYTKAGVEVFGYIERDLTEPIVVRR